MERVRYLVSIADEAQVTAMMARIRKLKKPSSGVRDGRTQYLDREGFERAFAAAVAAERVR